MDCATELKNIIAADCNNPAVAGTYGEVTLVPFDAIDRSASTVADNVISAIVLKVGRKGYSFATFDNSVLGAVSLNVGTYRNNLQHDLTLRVFVKTEDVKKFVNAFVNARIVAIVKNKEMGDTGETMYEAYGYDAGLVLNTLNADTSMADGVVYELVTGNDETSKEKSVPKSVWAGSLTDTETMLDTLVV